ncbi:3-phosphoshikimate 1-carboxyvinyltransferase [Nocardioides sp. Kera G14]|uniref:3-phosphoshikimate 1-carboxyvinyltransferase n=1 Tax=Nocardioides sp. Kera G14 TaxID=2884264 RepID=UPI001D0FA8DE|nr:3-phosphoshikimate 1-carboxyvinyltransferase [Nocardioides sp. Kera G14]UDY24677.1 3-phosphoshikimate 1-carboxyvinyltransferase [Nocardioides sp. Kera G14]
MIPDPWPAPHATQPVETVVSLPGSKSLTNRALILAAISDGPSTVHGALRSRDSLLMAGALEALGAEIDTLGPDWSVTPIPAVGAFERLDATVDVGLAGTVMRFVPPVAALSRGALAFDGDEHMRQRPVGRILDALRDLGVSVEGEALPFTLHGTGSVPGGVVTIDASESSQFVSALLLAGARYERGVDVRHRSDAPGSTVPSLPHIDMTVDMLRGHGVEVDTSEPNRWVVAPGPVKAVDETIEPDLSNAGPFLGLAALTGGTVTVMGWPEETTQPGRDWVSILSLMGCTVSLGEEGLTVTGPAVGHLQGVDLDLHDVGELTPVVAALCALASTPSRLTGIAHIRGHETDRLTALATELNALGASVEELPDGLVITPTPLHAGLFHTYADHRMAHAGVLLGAAVPGILVENVNTTSKTFTDFAPFWAGLFDTAVDTGS